MPQCYKRKFTCPSCDKEQERYKWTDDGTKEVCECGEEMEEVVVFESEANTPYYNYFKTLSKEEKQRRLRKRADEDFKKNHKEKKDQIDRELNNDMMQIAQQLKGKI